MKPRLRYRWSMLYNRYMWHCSGDGVTMVGDTPRIAHYRWQYRRRTLKEKAPNL
jgi:hypothetical protein